MSELVCYTDGSADPNPGFYGAGIHGYVFDEIVEKPVNADGWVVTNLGYYNKKEITMDTTGIAMVKPIKFIDKTIPLGNDGTNNQAEIIAVIDAMLIAIELKVEKLTVYTDSKYVCTGISEWLAKWKVTKFIKTNGEPVSNKDLWVRLDETLTELKKHMNIEVMWIKAHNGHIGNDKADLLAAIGTNTSRGSELVTTYIDSDVKGYWNPPVVRNPLLFHKRLYFNSTRDPDKLTTYYLADNDREDILIGKRKPESSYSVVKLAEPDVVLDLVINKQTLVTAGVNGIFMIKLDALYTKTVYPYLVAFKDKVLNTFRNSKNLTFVNRTPLSVELNPTFLSLRSVDYFNILECRLDDCISMLDKGDLNARIGNTDIQLMDVTDHYFEEYEIKKKVKTRLRLTISNIVKYIRIPVKHQGHTYNIPVMFGLDIPHRNNLKKLESPDTTVWLVITSDNDSNFSYSTIIRKDGDVSICSNYFSARVLCNRKKTKNT